MNRNLILVRTTFCFAFALLLPACDGAGEPATEAASTASAVQTEGVSPTEIVLGSFTDLSGPTAMLGVAITNGARMRFEEANAAGGIHGRQIRFVVEDSQYQVPRAVQAANKLMNRDHVFAMVLGLGTPMNNAVMPMLFEKGIPNLFPTSGARSMFEPYNRLQFVGRGSYRDEIRAAMSYYAEEEGITKPCVAYQDTDFGQETLEAAQEQAAALGLKIAEVTAHKPTDTEFTAAVLRLRNAGCDLVLLGTVYKDTVLLLEAARKLGWQNVRWAGTNAAYGYSIAAVESGASKGYSAFVHLPVVYRDDPDLLPAVAEWWDNYLERFGVRPEYGAQEGYRSADLVVQALQLAGPDLTRDNFIAALESFDDYTDLFGYHMSFGPGDHGGVKESILGVVRDGRWYTEGRKVSY